MLSLHQPVIHHDTSDYEVNDGNIVETERLFLRKLLTTDVDDLFTMDSDPRTHIYMGGTIPTKNKKESLEYINIINDQYMKYKTGRLAVIEKETNKFIGWCGVKFDTMGENNRKNYYEIGYRLLPEYWGRGFATESAIAALRHAFQMLPCEYIVGVAENRHTASCHILEKIGLNKKEEYMYNNIPNSWYEISRNEFLSLQQ